MDLYHPQEINYRPWGNAVMVFTVGSGLAFDPATRNVIQVPTELKYLAALNLQGASSGGSGSGASTNVYRVTGMLLTPTAFDTRIISGSQAEAVINGFRGKFDLEFDINAKPQYTAEISAVVQGTFRTFGGRN
jgi:hypothetical protein